MYTVSLSGSLVPVISILHHDGHPTSQQLASKTDCPSTFCRQVTNWLPTSYWQATYNSSLKDGTWPTGFFGSCSLQLSILTTDSQELARCSITLNMFNKFNNTTCILVCLWDSLYEFMLHSFTVWPLYYIFVNRPFYSCRLSDLAPEWQRGWSWPCFDTDLTAFIV